MATPVLQLETKTLRVAVVPHGQFVNMYRVRIHTWNTYKQAWVLVSNGSVKGLKTATNTAEREIEQATEREKMLEFYGHDPLTYK